jgi:hypothetical protein
MKDLCRYSVADRSNKGGEMEGVELSPKIEREADKLLAQIVHADSMIIAAKAGARAEGFVLDLESARALSEATIDRLYVIFDSATEDRLRALAAT